jgi:hypothetical protein
VNENLAQPRRAAAMKSWALHTGVPLPGALLGVPVGRLDGVVDVDVADLVGAGQDRGALGQAAKNWAATASSWRTWPNVNDRRKVPNVDGARIPVNNRPIPP